MKKLFILFLGIFSAFCLNSVRAADVEFATAHLRNSMDQRVGSVLFNQTPEGLDITVDIVDLPAGEHSLHIHENGSCVPPDFTSAGGHFNPYGTQHGFLNPEGPHAGDLPNITVEKNGEADVTITTKRLTLESGKPHSLLPFGTKSVVIHRLPDDYITDPAGQGGERIACGVIDVPETLTGQGLAEKGEAEY
ncbi:MAG: superoxide dismutase family protein [Candidatus Omnitrophota bacterium]